MATYTLKKGPVRVRTKAGWSAPHPAPAAAVGCTEVVAEVVTIGGEKCTVFESRIDGETYAQALDLALDPDSISKGTEPQPAAERES